MSIAFVESGTGRPVVLLPAFPGDHRLYADLLADPPCRIVAIDPPGFGATPPARGAPAPLTVDSYAALVGELMATLGLTDSVLVGVGLGGYVALEIAGDGATDITGLVVVGVVAAPDPPAKAPVRESLAVTALLDGMTAVADAQVDRALIASAGPEPRAAFRAMIESAHPEGFAAMSRGLAIRPDPREILARIRVPTLVLAGAEDPYAATADVQALAEAISGARFERVEGAGHLIPLEAPGTFRRLLVSAVRDGA